MATISISNKSELQKALDNASRGDKLVLDSGNYGTLSLNGNSKKADYKFDDITITSKDESKPAVFERVSLTNVTNVTFDDIKFDYKSGDGKPFLFNNTKGITIVDSEIDGKLSGGHGTGHGLWVINSEDFRLDNTDIHAFATGGHFRSVENLKVVGNHFNAISYDAMFFGRIGGALIEDNDVTMKGEAGVMHRDMIQFWNTDTNDPSHDIVIRGNSLIAAETVTHGIYFGNDVANKSGNISSFYKDILIENNTIKSGQVLGIAVAHTDGLTIRNNVVLQHASVDSTRPVDTPVIRVENDSRDVTISGNTTHKAPVGAAANKNWAPDDTPSSWKISGNKIVSIGTDGSANAGSSGGGSSKPVAPVAPVVPDEDGGNGKADNFRFKGPVDGKESVTFSNVHFGEGDRILLQGFDKGTFLDFAGGSGNKVVNNADKSYVRIDSLTDIQEIVTASKNLSVSYQKNDLLVLKIAQDDGTLSISLPGLADDYKSTFDHSLF